MIDAKAPTRTAEAGHHFVGYQEHVVARADLANLRPVLFDRRHDTAAQSHHRLRDKRSDRVGAILENLFLERGRAVEVA